VAGRLSGGQDPSDALVDSMETALETLNIWIGHQDVAVRVERNPDRRNERHAVARPPYGRRLPG